MSLWKLCLFEIQALQEGFNEVNKSSKEREREKKERLLDKMNEMNIENGKQRS